MSNYFKSRSKEDIQSYVTYVLINFCMPTLLKVKPSNLVNVNKKYIISDTDFFNRIAYEIEYFTSNYVILYENDTRLLLLIYNRELLCKTLAEKENKQFLDSFGYKFGENFLENTMERLKQRYRDYKNANSEFPHEIGVILGYPLRDVECFIKNNGRNYILCGFWKVYHNLEKATETFENYRRIRDESFELIFSGKTLKDINVTILN